METRILIIAPHPDDEVLGCGASMKKFANQGNKVFVLIMSRGTPKLYSPEKIENVRNEAREADKILGVSDTHFLDFHAPEMDDVPLADVSRAIAEIISILQINTLFIPHRGDIHNDHAVVFKAALVAARPVGNYTVKEIYAYETLSETEWAPPYGDDAFIPDFFVNITEELPVKLKALQCFKSQIKDFPNPRSLENIEALAKFRGATVGFHRAEAFMTIRRIMD
ncbi:MAG: PIG-L family deacetylase [Bacteroidales bacterium]|nr:PIG-L family deacetylase [Bacteroidales bacterium]